MRWLRGALPLVAIAFLCGCETERSGLDYSGMLQKIGPPRAGQARVVILREKDSGGLLETWAVQLDGTPMSGLKTGTYVYADRPSGQHQLTATAAGFPGTTHQDLALQSGRTYFLVARNSERKSALIATSSTGLLGFVVTSAVTSGYKNPGPLDFFPLDEGTARTTIAELKLAE